MNRKKSNTKVKNYICYSRKKFVGGNRIPQYAFAFMGVSKPFKF